VRGIFLKGAGIPALWHQFLALLALGVVMLGIAASRFRKTVA
jgi:ABC-2 type transport system permease protein